jgi:hypothetical protein
MALPIPAVYARDRKRHYVTRPPLNTLEHARFLHHLRRQPLTLAGLRASLRTIGSQRPQPVPARFPDPAWLRTEVAARRAAAAAAEAAAEAAAPRREAEPTDGRQAEGGGRDAERRQVRFARDGDGDDARGGGGDQRRKAVAKWERIAADGQVLRNMAEAEAAAAAAAPRSWPPPGGDAATAAETAAAALEAFGRGAGGGGSPVAAAAGGSLGVPAGSFLRAHLLSPDASDLVASLRAAETTVVYGTVLEDRMVAYELAGMLRDELARQGALDRTDAKLQATRRWRRADQRARHPKGPPPGAPAAVLLASPPPRGRRRRAAACCSGAHTCVSSSPVPLPPPPQTRRGRRRRARG